MADLLFTAMPCEGSIEGRFGQTDGFSSAHRGVDIGCREGTPIRWTGINPGVVVDFTNDGSFGLGVCVDLPGTPWFSLTAHMSRVDIPVGATVQPGQQLGLSGFTGTVSPPGAAGAHCHWQVCRSNAFPLDIAESTNPLDMIVVAGPVPSALRASGTDELLHAVATALTGMSRREDQLARLRAWNFFPSNHPEHPGEPRGNSLLDGFIELSDRVGELEAEG